MRTLVLAASLLLTACNNSASGGVSADFATKVCGALKTAASDMQGAAPEYVRANVVIAMAGTFNTNPKLLADVSEHIDEIAIDRCPKARNTLLAAAKLPTLQDVVR